MKAWPMVRMGDVLVPISRPEPVVATERYRLLGAHWYAEGLYVKDIKAGSEIQANQLYRVELGDFVYNRLFAWKGSFALVGEDVHGCYVSNEFPCFRLLEGRLDGRFLRYYFSQESVWNEALGLSAGGTPTSRNRLKEDRLLEMFLPLPPLEEQRRVVEELSSFSDRRSAVLRLRQESEALLQALCRSMLFSETNSRATQMSDVVSLRQTDTKVERHKSYTFAGVYCFGRGVFKGQTKSGTEFAYDRLTQIRAGEFTYPKLMAWEGALGVVPEECDGLFVSPEYPVFTIDTERLLPEVLDVYYRTPSVWPTIGGASTGTNVRRRRLHPTAFLSLRMPVPPMSTQLRIQRVRRAVEAISAIRRKSEVEVKSLLSAVITRAFDGSFNPAMVKGNAISIASGSGAFIGISQP
jgi:type I restriction enzyme S subunit